MIYETINCKLLLRLIFRLVFIVDYLVLGLKKITLLQRFPICKRYISQVRHCLDISLIRHQTEHCLEIGLIRHQTEHCLDISLIRHQTEHCLDISLIRHQTEHYLDGLKTSQLFLIILISSIYHNITKQCLSLITIYSISGCIIIENSLKKRFNR